MRMRMPLLVDLGLITLFFTLFLVVELRSAVTEEDDTGRVTLTRLSEIVGKGVWPVHVLVVGVVMEGRWGCETVGERADERAKEELVSVVDRREREEEEGVVAKTWTRLLREAPVRAILINHADVSLGEPIARGGGGMVRKGLLYGKFEVATESLYSQFMMGELDDMEKADRRKGAPVIQVLAEALIISGLQHPSVLPIYGISLAPTNTVYLLSELCVSNLESHVLSDICSPSDVARSSFALLQAVGFLLANGIVHRDLKHSNILLARDSTLKVADMRHALRVQTLPSFLPPSSFPDAGTPLYLAPRKDGSRHGARV
ncbi:protein kinase [Nannochloropsis oceanica]